MGPQYALAAEKTQIYFSNVSLKNVDLPKSAFVGSKSRSLGKLSIPLGNPRDVDAEINI